MRNSCFRLSSVSSIILLLAYLSGGCSLPTPDSHRSKSIDVTSNRSINRQPSPSSTTRNFANPKSNSKSGALQPKCKQPSKAEHSDFGSLINQEVAAIECTAEPVIREGERLSRQRRASVMQLFDQCQAGNQAACREHEYWMRVWDRNYEAADRKSVV